MPEDHGKERPSGGQWAQQQKQGMEKQSQQQGGQHKSEGQQQQGDERTPDQPIGQVAYADGRKKQQKPDDGGAGQPEISKLEPEKQGGIGGP